MQVDYTKKYKLQIHKLTQQSFRVFLIKVINHEKCQTLLLFLNKYFPYTYTN
jgi:hypothetical protein